MRFLVFAFVLAFAAGCTHTGRQDETAERTVAQVMIAAMIPVEQARSGYAWAAVEARVAPPVRWHGDAFAPEILEGSGLQRNGWLQAPGRQFDVRVMGSHTEVRQFSVDVNDAVETEALLKELRAAGAEVSGAGDDETAMIYYVTVPGRETAQLEARRTCTPYGSRSARHCRSIMSWNLEPQ